MRAAPHVAIPAAFGRLLDPGALAGFVARMWRVAGERRQLAELDPRLLRDIGVDPMTARQEIERPLWDLPAHDLVALRNNLRF